MFMEKCLKKDENSSSDLVLISKSTNQTAKAVQKRQPFLLNFRVSDGSGSSRQSQRFSWDVGTIAYSTTLTIPTF